MEEDEGGGVLGLLGPLEVTPPLIPMLGPRQPGGAGERRPARPGKAVDTEPGSSQVPLHLPDGGTTPRPALKDFKVFCVLGLLLRYLFIKCFIYSE